MNHIDDVMGAHVEYCQTKEAYSIRKTKGWLTQNQGNVSE